MGVEFLFLNFTTTTTSSDQIMETDTYIGEEFLSHRNRLLCGQQSA
jgi:hypothetical protein